MFAIMRKILVVAAFLVTFLFVFSATGAVFAQGIHLTLTPTTTVATPTVTHAPSKAVVKKNYFSNPQNDTEQTIQSLFAQRPANHLTYLNFCAYFVQYAVKIGVPANTIGLILLLPLLATIVAF